MIDRLTEKILQGGLISRNEAVALMNITDPENIIFLIAHANRLREKFKGPVIGTCSIINAKSGRCSEDCKFCAQAARHKTDIESYPLVDRETIIEKAQRAKEFGAKRFSIVTSGRGVKNRSELDSLCGAIKDITDEVKIKTCASLGVLDEKTAGLLKDAGLERYHHNLETAQSFFPEICTTHSYHERLETLRIAEEAGLGVCCGGVFGIGESPDQRLEFAFALRELDVDSVPMNFLNPIPGTPLENEPPISPMEIIKLIALYRFVLPQKDIRICGGRQKNLRNTQALMYLAGANAVMIGDYLTVPGSDPAEDIRLIKDLMLIPE